MKTIRKSIEDFFNSFVYKNEAMFERGRNDVAIRSKNDIIIIQKSDLPIYCCDVDVLDCDIYNIFVVKLLGENTYQKQYGTVFVTNKIFNGFWFFALCDKRYISKSLFTSEYTQNKKNIIKAAKTAKNGIHILEPKKNKRFYVAKNDSTVIVLSSTVEELTSVLYNVEVQINVVVGNKFIPFNENIIHALNNYAKFYGGIARELVDFYKSLRKPYSKTTKKQRDKIKKFIGHWIYDKVFALIIDAEDVKMRKKYLYQKQKNNFSSDAVCTYEVNQSDGADVDLIKSRMDYCSDKLKNSLINELKNDKKYIKMFAKFSFDEGDVYIERTETSMNGYVMVVNTPYGEILMTHADTARCATLSTLTNNLYALFYKKISTIMRLSNVSLPSAIKIASGK